MGTPLVVRGYLGQDAGPVDVVLQGERIREVTSVASPDDGPFLGGPDCLLSEAFLDIQVNGFAGVDFNRPGLTAADLRHAMEAMWRHGVTRFFPTIITAPPAAMEAILRTIARAREEDVMLAHSIPGIHLEGPFLSPVDGPRGAHPVEAIRDPDWKLFSRLQEASGGLIRLVTLAPERPGAIELIQRLRQAGITVAIGHTEATDEEIDRAVDAGAQLSTHLGNGAHAVLPRHRNYIQKQLATDALMASFIVDGHHLPDYFVKNAIRCKGTERVILITDAMAAASAPPGTHRLGQVEAESGQDGAVRLPGTPYLAGSALTMDRAVENAARFAGLPIAETVRLATRQPRRLFPDLGAGLRPGEPADLVLLRDGPPLCVVATVAAGELVYAKL
jgi:N-acetylglucosamine-6-phosphate deacetylase